MLLVETYVSASPIEGVGVFAAEPIQAGSLVWTLDPRIDRILTQTELQSLPDTARRFFDRYAYFDRILGAYLLDGDHSRFLNHTETPSIEFRLGGTGYALRDIAAGEELTCDYREFMDELELARHCRSGTAGFEADVQPARAAAPGAS